MKEPTNSRLLKTIFQFPIYCEETFLIKKNNRKKNQIIRLIQQSTINSLNIII